MKKYLNIDLNGTILTISCQYDTEAQTYILDEEIVVKQWTIKKVIKHCDSHDYNANYEYIIKDKFHTPHKFQEMPQFSAICCIWQVSRFCKVRRFL